MSKLSKGQSPQILWIGCSDSRVPETTILGLQPGDVFVHRNIANVLPPTDLSSQAVITYAVAHLKVKQVVVCGHTSCGGVAAALANGRLGVIDTWLLPLRQLRKKHKASWDKENLSEDDRKIRLVEENVRQGVQTVREHHDVVAASKEGRISVHGLVYDVGSGSLREIECGEEEEEGKAREEAFHVN
ncbi:carbonic anhydrase [Physcia stellaris]|nr:carbonic anhydrase [Physcia stellaris]